MNKSLFAALIVSVAAPVAVAPAPAGAQSSNDRYYRGSDGRYYRECKRSKGTTGTIAGAAGGALAGHLLGGGTLGTIAGGVGGGLLGRHIDQRHDAAQNRKNGC